MNGEDHLLTIDKEPVPETFVSRFPDKGNPLPDSSQLPSPHREELGEPLAIEEVATLLGCSAWTVRQRYLRQGLPYLQARPRGKLVFFREQVIGWIQKRQRQKGGLSR